MEPGDLGLSTLQDTPRTPQELQLDEVAGYTVGPSGALGRSSLFVRASGLGSRGWGSSGQPFAQGAGPSRWLQGRAARTQLAGPLAGRLLEGGRGHMAPGDRGLQHNGNDSSTEHVGEGWEAASVHTLGTSEVQTEGTPWT